ncbi:hypothetical protein AB1Y20_016597 [Prymnesium parvum]|uniref:Uncharacterized protein n=1 Tax=Prymnesium parvum TaxID=97485 RepID=A0AB34ICY1_PRYPA
MRVRDSDYYVDGSMALDLPLHLRGALINSCRGTSLRPNVHRVYVRPRSWTVHDLPLVVFKASCDIAAGTFLRYDYAFRVAGAASSSVADAALPEPLPPPSLPAPSSSVAVDASSSLYDRIDRVPGDFARFPHESGSSSSSVGPDLTLPPAKRPRGAGSSSQNAAPSSPLASRCRWSSVDAFDAAAFSPTDVVVIPASSEVGVLDIGCLALLEGIRHVPLSSYFRPGCEQESSAKLLNTDFAPRGRRGGEVGASPGAVGAVGTRVQLRTAQFIGTM